MYCDLYLPFPTSSPGAGPSNNNASKKGKGKAPPALVEQKPRNCWDGVGAKEKEEVDKVFALAGHLGYTIVANSAPSIRSTTVPPSPFVNQVPHPGLDPRYSDDATGSRRLVQLSRITITLDDSSQHGLNAVNSAALSSYDLIAVIPTTANAFSNACLKLSEPGPNQVSIISLPLHQNHRMPFFAKRSLVKTALRNGAVFEIPYAQALGTSDPSLARKYRQNFLTNAREVIRVVLAVSGGGGRDGTTGNRGKGGGGIIFSSGIGVPGSMPGVGMRSPADLINLAVMLGMPSNQAKDAIAFTPRAVLLKAQARRAHKGVTTVPRMVPGEAATVHMEPAALTGVPSPVTHNQKNSKRKNGEDGDGTIPRDIQPVKSKKAKTGTKA
ncbi:hypothetical protein QFC21_004900 [Naganishia friedmannii]|uniref:Uncharacterized protein n=1 Tax=Naganishia friedmannii TaxID=89922 RepID=A0ACC2VEE1_9TREE|nr:hypothetical protein QFC21_004900 [Naganishia friedmannii]